MVLSIKIKRQNDTTPLYPEMAKYIGESKLKKCIILEHGTEAGKSSLMLQIELPDGSNSVVQITGEIFKLVCRVLTNAEKHWQDEPVESVWK